MAIKNFNFIVDTINVNNNIVANVKQLDSAIFNITITENNQLKDLTNQTLKLFVKKADGSILVQTDNISITDSKNGKISININNSIFASAGIVIAEIDINGDDGDIATATFSFNVYAKIGDNEAVKANVDIDLFKQITDLMAQATKEISDYKSFFDSFTTAGVSVQGLADIKAYIDNNLANLKNESNTANTLDRTLKATIQDSTTAKTDLNNTILNSTTAQKSLEQIINKANNQGYLTTDELNKTLDTFVPYLIWQGITSDNCNTLVKNGFYSVNATAIKATDVNYPLDGEWALLFAWSTQGATDGGTVIQLFYGLTSKRLFYRMFNDSGWRDWAEIVTTDTLNKSLEDIKTLIDTKIQEIKPTTVEGITENSNGIILEDNQSWKSFSAERTVNNQVGSLELGIDTQYNNPALSLHFLLNKTLQSTFEMLVNGEFKLKDNIGTGTTALLFCNNNGETDKGWIGKYNNDQFTIKANSDDLVLTNNYGSNIRVGQGGYFYPDSDGHWALGKSGYRWSNLYTKNITNSSDRNLKENIKYLNTTATNFKDTSITTDDLYNFVKDNLKLATYDYKDTGNEDEYSKGKLGFIAQDFLNNPIGRSIVQQADDSYLSYDLNNYINLLAGALQKAILNIENLKELSQLSSSTALKASLLGTQISNLTMQNLQLQQRIKALENKLNINN